MLCLVWLVFKPFCLERGPKSEADYLPGKLLQPLLWGCNCVKQTKHWQENCLVLLIPSVSYKDITMSFLVERCLLTRSPVLEWKHMQLKAIEIWNTFMLKAFRISCKMHKICPNFCTYSCVCTPSLWKWLRPFKLLHTHSLHLLSHHWLISRGFAFTASFSVIKLTLLQNSWNRLKLW